MSPEPVKGPIKELRDGVFVQQWDGEWRRVDDPDPPLTRLEKMRRAQRYCVETIRMRESMREWEKNQPKPLHYPGDDGCADRGCPLCV